MEKQPIAGQCIATNISANEVYIQKHYPNEIFIIDMSQIKHKNKYSKGLVIPENVKVAESRIPINPTQRAILRKELRQAEILAELGNSVYIIPEKHVYKVKPKDAVVNGELFEFRTVEGNAETFQWEFRKAKGKGADTNVYINILSDINKKEAWHRIWLVLRRHPEYTGKIVISFKNGEKILFWNTDSFRKKNPCRQATGAGGKG